MGLGSETQLQVGEISFMSYDFNSDYIGRKQIDSKGCERLLSGRESQYKISFFEHVKMVIIFRSIKKKNNYQPLGN